MGISVQTPQRAAAMEKDIAQTLGLGGFSFENTRRNQVLAAQPGMAMPKARKTGTTLAGVIFEGGVVLGADTRATGGDTVCDKNCDKIHYIADNIWCCGAGTSADTEASTALVSSQLELHRMATNKGPRVMTALTMLKRMLFRYQGHVSAALVLGGVDCNGPSLYTVYPHGSTDSLPYVTMGSGSLAAMAVFEAAIKSGINNDLGSGGSVDLMVITAKGYTHHRNIERPNLRKFRKTGGYDFPKNTAHVLSQSFTPISSLVTIETTVTPSASAMEVS